MKKTPLGPSPEELEKRDGIDLSRPRRARGRVTKTIRNHEDPRLKAKRFRRQFVSSLDRKRMRTKDVPPNCVLIYMRPENFNEIMDRDTNQICKEEHKKLYINGEPGRGMDVFIVLDSDISQIHITYITSVSKHGDIWEVK